MTPSTEQDLTQPQTFPPFPHELSVTASDLLDVIPLLQMDGDPSPFPSIELSTNPDMPSEALDVPLNTTTPHVHNPYELAFNPGYITSSQPTLYSTTLDPTTSTTNTQPPQPFPQQPSSYPSFVALGSDNSESLLNEMLSTPAQPMVWPPSLPSLQQTATLQQVPPILGAHALPTGDFLTNSTLPLDTDKFQPSFEGHQTDQGVHLPSPRSTFSPPPYIPLEASPKLQDNGSGETSANSTQSSTPLETPTTQCSISKGQLQCSDQAMLEQHLEVYLEDILDGCDDSFSDIDSYDVDVGYDELFSDLESFWVNFPKSPLQKLESDTKKDPAKELLKELDMDPDTTLEEFADSLLAKSSYSHSSKSSCPRPSTPVASMANETTSTPSTSDVQVVSTPDPQVNEDAKHSSVENRDLGSGSSDEISCVESALSLIGRAENSREWRALDIDDLVELIQSGGNKNSTPTAAKPEMTKESRKRSAEEAFGDAQPMGTKKAKKEAEDSFSISNGNITCYGMAANFSSDPHTAPPHLEGKNSEGNEESALPQCLTMNDDLLAALHLQAIDIQFFSLFSTEDIEQLQTTSN